MAAHTAQIDTPELLTPDPYVDDPSGHSQQPLQVLMVIGSTRQDRFGPVPATWAAEQARLRDDVEVDVIDLAEANLPVVLAGDDRDAPLPQSVIRFSRRVEAADAVVIVTPVYNRGYPASLKNAIDWVHDEWAATPVGFISYGGRTGGIEAVEQLRTIFAELNTMTIRQVMSFPNFWEHFTDHGAPVNPETMTTAATSFYDQLTWWACALRTARNRNTP